MVTAPSSTGNNSSNNSIYLATGGTDEWKHNIYGDDLSSVTSELTLKWTHANDDETAERHYREFHSLKEFLEKEGLFQ